MSMELKLPDFLENYDRQTNQQGDRKVSLPIIRKDTNVTNRPKCFDREKR